MKKLWLNKYFAISSDGNAQTISVRANHLKAIIYMVVACILFAINNNVIKYAGVSVAPTAMVFYKNFISLLLLLPFVFFIKGKIWSISHFNRYNILRSILDVMGVLLWFMAIINTPISQAVALSFLTPLFIAALAIMMLQEKVSKERWMIMTIGLIGAIIVARPEVGGAFNSYTLLVVVASFLWAISAVLFKKLTFIQESFVLLFYLKIIKSVASFPFLLYDFQSLDGAQLLYMVIIGICTNLAIFMVAKSYKYANISVVIPFDFMRLVFTAMIAFVVFGEHLTVSVVLGSMVILISSSVLVSKEYKNKRMT